MADVKLTKNALRAEQIHLAQLEKYLPTLQLKKAMLQTELSEVKHAIERLEVRRQEMVLHIESFSALLTTKATIDPLQAIQVKRVKKRYENIAGVEVPYFEGVEFEAFEYNLFETPPWIDAAIAALKELATVREEVGVAYEQREAIEKEWREVSIRVNLFEKILIPRAIENIRKIKVFLGDQQLASVSRAKVAKAKIETAKALAESLQATVKEERS